MLQIADDVNKAFKERMVWWQLMLTNIKFHRNKDPKTSPVIEFILWWLIFDAYISEISISNSDEVKLVHFFSNQNSLREYIENRWPKSIGSLLKKFSPFRDSRPNQNPKYLNDENSLEETIRFLHAVRSSLVHGSIDLTNAQHLELIRCAKGIIYEAINGWMTAEKV